MSPRILDESVGGRKCRRGIARYGYVLHLANMSPPPIRLQRANRSAIVADQPDSGQGGETKAQTYTAAPRKHHNPAERKKGETQPGDTEGGSHNSIPDQIDSIPHRSLKHKGGGCPIGHSPVLIVT